MAKAAELGKNRTGIDMSPADAERMISGAKEFSSAASADGRTAIAALEREYIAEAEPIGSVPAPGTLRGALKTGAKKATGKNPEVFLNKLGERLAYERTGVRLYESVITKVEAADQMHPAGPVTVDELQQIRDEEMQHFQLLSDVAESLGADPTALTPAANVAAVATMGIPKVLNDPRTTVAQCLDALLTLELVDNAAWELLIQLADNMGLKDASEQFQRALEQEKEHLATVRSWLEEITTQEARRGAQARH
ncbi:MAG TPA: ferritin-like domain-containing protein [Woeseiaceae bacterium]|nr:ferritin-like domain-containing protein [Woeseiaceae bacterium]